MVVCIRKNQELNTRSHLAYLCFTVINLIHWACISLLFIFFLYGNLFIYIYNVTLDLLIALFDYTMPSLEVMPENLLRVETTPSHQSLSSSVLQIPGNLFSSDCKATAMKCPSYKSEKMEDVYAPIAEGAADPLLLNLKFSPVKLEPSDIKPKCPPTAELLTTQSPAGTEASQDKENRTSGLHNRTLEDSGYLTLHNSHIEDSKEDGHCSTIAVAHQGKVSSQQSSPTKCQRRTSPCQLTASPIEGHRGRAGRQSASSASSNCISSTLPLLRFHEAVCEELAKDFKKNKR